MSRSSVNTAGVTELAVAIDGVVTLRPPVLGDAAVLIAGRDAEFHRWLGPGTDDPRPTACVVVDGEIVGWIDYDTGRDWLRQGAVNIGYFLFAPARGKGYATRAMELLLDHLATHPEVDTATVLIDPGNVRSLAVANRAGFTRHDLVNGSVLLTRPVPQAR
jgi:RimJ/RimL family protein N-acetyltransferase